MFAEELESFLEERTDGRKHLMHFNSTISSLVPDNGRYFFDTVLVYDTISRANRRTDDFDSDLTYEESWQDILALADVIEKDENAKAFVNEGFEDRVKSNLEEGEHGQITPEEETIDEVVDFYSSFAETVDLRKYEAVGEEPGRSINYWDRKLISAAEDLDATVLTYDGDFLGYTHLVDVATPGRALEHMS